MKYTDNIRIIMNLWRFRLRVNICFIQNSFLKYFLLPMDFNIEFEVLDMEEISDETALIEVDNFLAESDVHDEALELLLGEVKKWGEDR